MAGTGKGWRGVAALAVLLASFPAGSARRGGEVAADGIPPSLVRGPAEVHDGDTLRIGAQRIRLFGIDAPEVGQACDSGDKGTWPCGAVATERLRALIGDGPVTCAPRDRDRYGRLVATCTAGRVDLGGRLVAEGLARAYTRFGDDYREVERQAKTDEVGLWHGISTAPWDFRAAHAPAAPVPPTPGCAIKGNVGTSGAKVYHLPGARSYEKTRIDPRRGEAWFCDAAAAEAAGFRPARN